MNIINKVTDENYTQWIEKFVARILKNAHIKYSKVVIDDIESNKRVFYWLMITSIQLGLGIIMLSSVIKTGFLVQKT